MRIKMKKYCIHLSQIENFKYLFLGTAQLEDEFLHEIPFFCQVPFLFHDFYLLLLLFFITRRTVPDVL